MADIFISYANEDRDYARRLASALETHGWSVWWDRKIITGQTFDQVIEHELDKANSVVVLWSNNSVSSEWVKNESAVAAERNKLVPALIDTVKLPLEFRRKQTADLIGWKGDPSHEGFKALCDGVSAAITGVVPDKSTILPSHLPSRKPRWVLFAVLSTVMLLGLGSLLMKEKFTKSTTMIDYTSQMSPVRDNGAEGSTVGFGVAAALEYQITKAFGINVIVSPRYIYYYARKKEGISTDKDSGANLQYAIDVLLDSGAVLEEEWPYKAGEFAAKPPKNVTRAVHYKISRVEQIRNINDLKLALKQFGPVVGEITFYKSIIGPDVSRTGIIPFPSSEELQFGGDAVCIVGFDDTKQLLKFKNHWGVNWGDNGYGYISYKYAEKFLGKAWALSSPPIKYVPTSPNGPA